MANRIQLRRDIAADWTSTNPILALGEKGLETDTLKEKVGDGVTAWNSLAYWNDSSGLVSFPGFTSLLVDYGFTDNSTNWNTAFGWGDHTLAGYLTSYTETQTLEDVRFLGNIISGDIDFNSNSADNVANIDFKSGLTPVYKEGRLTYDTDTKGLTFFNDETETALNIGEEQRVRVYNNNGSTILNGQVVTVTGVQPNGAIEVGLAIASDITSALNTIGIATHDIEIASYGWATTSGMINGLNTTILKDGGALTEGVAIYLSETVAGDYQETRPLSPSYEVRMGGVAVASATVGKIYAELRIISNDQDNNSFFNGAILEPNTVHIHSNGTTVNCELHSLAANGKLSLIFDQNYISVADGINIDLNLGLADAPLENWVYITSAGVMTVSTNGFPTGVQYTPVARVVVPDAITAQTYGVYKVHAYTDHLQGTNGQGHLTHINEWIRKRPAAWQNGVVLTQSVAEGTSIATINLAYTSGIISQLHEHTFPVYDTATKPAFIVNDFTTPYTIANGITSAIDTDASGSAIANNKYYPLVVWGVISEESVDSKLFFNLPAGSYTNVTDAINDVDNFADYTIPTTYLGTGFLITKLVVQRGTSNVTVVSGGTVDLRGSIPAVGGGSTIGGAGITVFDSLTDTPITKVGNSLKHVRVNVGETALEYVTPNRVDRVLAGDGIGVDANAETPTVSADVISVNGAIGIVSLDTDDITATTTNSYISQTDLTRLSLTSGTNTGDQTLSNTSDATSHTTTLSSSGGSIKLIEGSGITLTTAGTALDGTVTITSAAGGGNVTKVGIPVDNQIGVWTGDGTIEGTTNLSFNMVSTVATLSTSEDFFRISAAGSGTYLELNDEIGMATVQGGITADQFFHSSATGTNSLLANGSTINKLTTTVTGEPTGSDILGNIVSLTQAEYDAGVIATTIQTDTHYMITDATAPTAVTEFADDVFRVIGSADATKKLAFEVDGNATTNTTTVTIQDKNGTMAYLSDTLDIPSGLTGTALSTTNPVGTYYNMASASSSTTFTFSGSVIGGWAMTLISGGASEPTVTSATKIAGATWTSAAMYLVVRNNGNRTEFFFLEI